MADQFDMAQERDEQARQAAVAAQQRKASAATRLQAVGYCLNPACELPFNADEPQRLFCGPKCAAEHTRRTRN